MVEILGWIMTILFLIFFIGFILMSFVAIGLWVYIAIRISHGEKL